MPDPSPYAPSEAYLNALRSFGFTDEQCVEELRQARESDFELLLADEKRKAYDQGDSQGYSKGYNTGYDWGKKDGKVLGYAEGYDEGRSEAQSYSQYIQANAHRMREGWQPVCFDEFMESEFLVENEP